MKFRAILMYLVLSLPARGLIAGSPSEAEPAAQAEARQDWPTALSLFEQLYDSTRTDDAQRAVLRTKIGGLRSQVAPNKDTTLAGVWRVRAYIFRQLRFDWKDKEGKSHHADFHYGDEEIQRVRKGMEGFASRVWNFTSGNLRIDWKLEVIDKPLTHLDGEESFWPGPDACMPYLEDLQPGQADTVMIFAKVFGDPAKGETGEQVPQMLLGGAIGVADPLTRGATYIGFNWGPGTAADEPDGEPMLHEWLHSAQWALEEHQGYPPGLMATSDGGKMEGEPGGDPCYRRKPTETSWMNFYRHIMTEHVTRRMWRELSPNLPATNTWMQAQAISAYVAPSEMDCPWPKMSHYKQPWRGYLETRSGYDFLRGLGVNLHIPVENEDLAMRLLAETGFKSFRIEIGWGEMKWEENALNNEKQVKRRLEFCAKHGIRPTLLLNAHQGVPCPVRFFDRQLLRDAKKGDRKVRLDNCKDLVIGRSGLSDLSDYWAAEALVTALDPETGEATLSKPLPKDLPAGRVQMATLKFAPLHPVGSPEFEETAGGWIRYAVHICRLAEEAGLREFDLEIWNELTFGTHFLDINDYYVKESPKVGRQPDFLHEGGRCWELARRTVAAVKKEHPRVRIIWGFSNTTFFHCPIDKLPPGVDGQSYHPYGTGTREFKGRQERPDQPPLEGFVPRYTLRMPEGWASTFVQTESLSRLLRPDARLSQKPQGVDRFYHYMTEHGVLPPECGVNDDDASWNLKALCATRSFAFWLNKGVDVLHYFDAFEDKPTSFGLLPANLKTLSADSRFQDVATLSMRAVRNLAQQFNGSVALEHPDPLQFDISTLGPSADIFAGAKDHPPLRDFDVLAVLPFQLNPDRHLVLLYVMTRDVMKPFPLAPFRLRISGLKGGDLSAVDVISGEPVLVRQQPISGGKLEVSLYLGVRPVALSIGK